MKLTNGEYLVNYRMIVISKITVISCFMAFQLLLPSEIKGQKKEIFTKDQSVLRLEAKSNFRISPYTGYTRAQWLEITERIIAGVMPYFNNLSGLPDLPSDPRHKKVETDTKLSETKQTLERAMIAVVIYTTATKKDIVPGFSGSISKPFLKAIIRGTDPNDPLFWGKEQAFDQVGSVFALAVYLNPRLFWDPLTEVQKSNLLNYLSGHALTSSFDNNHYFFHMAPVPLLTKYGYPDNRDQLTSMYNRLMGWYRGNGWFLDGSNRGFDYYNLWGFQLFNQVLYRYDEMWRLRFGMQVRKSTAEFVRTLPFLFGRDGGPIPWGRSIVYRFAGNAAIAWAVLNGMSTIPPGQARRIASGSLKYFWEHGCLDDHHLLSMGYWGTNTSVAESYITAGSPYWATQGLACLLIPETDPFWTAPEGEIPADRRGGKIDIPGAQFSVRVSPVDGEARLFPSGQPFMHSRNMWQVGAKYDQDAYSSYLGWCVAGEDGADLGAGRTGYSYDKRNWFYREHARSLLITPDHLCSAYYLKDTVPNSKVAQYDLDEMTSHTLVGNEGEILIFWHNHPEPVYLHIGGYGISMPSGSDPATESRANKITVHAGRYFSTITEVSGPKGAFSATVLTPVNGWKDSHLFGGTGVFPAWRSCEPVPPMSPVIFYKNGTRDRKPQIPVIRILDLHGKLRVWFENKWYTISTFR